MENCAATCPVVTKAIQASSKEGLVEMAIAAIEAEKISQREAARRFGVSNVTISRHIKKSGDLLQVKQAITSEERQKWHQDKADGMNISQIAKKHERDRASVRKELKKDPPVVKPTIKPEGMASEIIAREKKTLAKQAKGLDGLVLLEREMQRHWKSDQKRFDKSGRSVWQSYAKEAHDAISSNGCLKTQREVLGLADQASYLEVLEEMEVRALSVVRSIQWMKYLSGYTDLPKAPSHVN